MQQKIYEAAAKSKDITYARGNGTTFVIGTNDKASTDRL